MRIGVLALQGAVEEHCLALGRLGVSSIGVKTRRELDAVDGLIVPGGESTTVIRLLERFALDAPLIARVQAGMPLWGTCMGMIVIATDVAQIEQRTLGLLDVTVRRNAFGRQNASATVPLLIPTLGQDLFPAVYIRAPWIERCGTEVECLAEREGHGVLVRQHHLLASSFHPELSGDLRLHGYFVEMVRSAWA